MEESSVKPRTFLIGQTTINREGLHEYLKHTGQQEFMETFAAAKRDRMQDAEILPSIMAKLCYKALTVGKNPNISRVRDIPDNLKATYAHGHGSVFEHPVFNFITTGCSRVFTHELVRHRVGTAFSQTSGRYVRLDAGMELVLDPILTERLHPDVLNMAQLTIEDTYAFLKVLMGLHTEEEYMRAEETWKPENFARIRPRVTDPNEIKKITSALRRFVPQGISNEIGWSCNTRALRHMMMLRTSRHAEWEIRLIFNQVWDLIYPVFPWVFHGATVETVDGLIEVTNMIAQPYELSK